jgi:hypothetical protein
LISSITRISVMHVFDFDHHICLCGNRVILVLLGHGPFSHCFSLIRGEASCVVGHRQPVHAAAQMGQVTSSRLGAG